MSETKPPGEPIDWAAIQAKLARSLALIEGGEQDDGRNEQLLRQRAVALAKPAPSAPGHQFDAGSIEVLVFQVGGERYAFETSLVAQVIPMAPITVLPGVPSYIVGIVAFEGAVLAVVDLRSLLALPVVQLAEAQALVVLAGSGREFAVLAETIAGVQRYRRDTLEPNLPALANLERSFLQGVAQDRTAILNAGQLLKEPNLVVHADR